MAGGWFGTGTKRHVLLFRITHELVQVDTIEGSIHRAAKANASKTGVRVTLVQFVGSTGTGLDVFNSLEFVHERWVEFPYRFRQLGERIVKWDHQLVSFLCQLK